MRSAYLLYIEVGGTARITNVGTSNLKLLRNEHRVLTVIITQASDGESKSKEVKTDFGK